MKKRYPGVGKQIAILGLCFQFSQLSCVSNAVAAPPQLRGYYGKLTDLAPPLPNALPTGENIRHGIGSVVRDGSNMTVHQNKPQAVIHWRDFNIGSQASVAFDQQDQSWKVLNRVTGDGYSQIYGSLSAKGQVYLLNQNGILFGPGAQVNVHTLVASSLNMREEDYLHTDPGTGQEYVEFPKFSAAGREAYYHDPARARATVANHGTITSNGAFGGLFLIGSDVENHGSMEAPSGQVALAAGESVELRQHEVAGNLTSYAREPKGSLIVTASGGADSGTATNFGVEYNKDGTLKYKAARITADNGLAGMYGSFVNQEGLIRSVTSNTAAGNIELKAAYRVTTGVNSETSTPIYVPTTKEEQKQDRIIAGAGANDLTGKITITAAEGSIEHRGKISAPGGQVTLTAKDRVLLENNSSIDVSGSWVGLSAGDHVVEVQLNSKELRDAFVLKGGPLLGEKVQVDTLTGLSIADISEYLSSRGQSSLERTVNGGEITIEATGDNGEVVVKKDALLKFGGGVRVYGEGVIEDTPVRVGNRMYSLSQLPEGMRVDEVLGRTVKEHERWGKKSEWEGLYYGGSTPLKRYLPSFKQGGDAGRLTIKARKVVLDGALNASVVRGIYQDSLENPRDENGYLMAAGRRIPVAGSLTLGQRASQKTSIVEDIVIAKEVAATEVRAGELLADHAAPIRTSFLDADTLNAAQLGRITLHSNTRVVVDKGVELRLENPAAKADVLGNKITAAVGGEFSATAKAIEHYGSIVAPGGTITLATQYPFIQVTDPSLKNPLELREEWLNISHQIFLGEKSLLSTVGEGIDNSTATGDKARPKYGLTGGGGITLTDEMGGSLGVRMVQGAAIDVSGGYEITPDGAARGGDAGEFTVVASTMALDGALRGYALPGRKGGTIRLHADTVNVAKTAPVLPAGFSADDPLPAGMRTGLVLAENRLNGTGFSNIELKAAYDLTVEQGVSLAPSYSRSTHSGPALLRGRQPSGGIVEVEPEYAGTTSIILKTGEAFNQGNNRGFSTHGNLLLAQGSTLTVAPGGAIALKADGGTAREDLTVQGQVIAPAGAISLNGTNITLAEGSRLDASGATVADLETTGKGLPVNRKVLNGGSVVLDAGETVTMARNAVIDVSGSEVVTNTLSSPAGPVAQTLASAPGSIAVNYKTDFVRQGDLLGKAHLAGLPGGSVTISSADPITGQIVRQEDIDHYLANGFDDITLASGKALIFNDSVAIHAGRRLTLNSPELAGTGEHTVSLAAPWLRLWNIKPGSQSGDNNISNDNTTPAGGKGLLKADADFIDVQGDVALAGLGETTLRAARDIRLYDYFYNDKNKWSGGLRTGGNLTMQAAAIYPATLDATGENGHSVFPSDFTIKAAGKVTTLPGQAGNRQPIASAGGRLRIEAQDIEHRGEIAAPMGTVELEARGRVLLAEGSTISTKGETRALYGTLQNENWEVRDGKGNSTDTLTVDAAPGKKVMVSGKEVIQAVGAEIDVSGGGSILAYEFLPGFDGTVNPLAKEGRFVVMADNSVSVPGAAVYLEGLPGLPAGTYAILPAEYAFQPGAMVIEKTGSAMAPGQVTATTEGYTVVAGYDTEAGTGLVSPVREGYIVRSAADVLRLEGKFDLKEMVAGDAGRVEISGATTILAGSVKAKALDGYKGGALDLSAANIAVANGMGDLLAGVDLNDFKAPLDAGLSGKMFLDTALFTGKGLQELVVGREGITDKITLQAGTKIDTVPTVVLTAKANTGAIVLEDGASVEAMGRAGESEGAITLSAQTVKAGENTSLRASDLLQINTDNLRAETFKADIGVEHGTLGFAGKKIFLEPEKYNGSRAEGGIYLNDDMLKKFASTDTVELTSKSDLVFLGSVGLAAGNDLTLDAARITTANNGVADTVTVDAGKGLRIQNRSGNSLGDDTENKDSIAFTAKTITFGPNIEVTAEDKTVSGATFKLDNFKSVGFASSGETVFDGKGTLKADLGAGGELTMEASRFLSTMTPETDGDKLLFTAGNYTVDSTLGNLVFAGNGKQGTGIVAMPGALTLKGNKIDLKQALIDLPSGKLVMDAANNITMTGASILARGGAFNFPIRIGTETYDNRIALSGGQVALTSASGTISIDADSGIDTSATDGQKGGDIVLEAAVGGVGLDGTVKGGSFAMDTDTIGDFGKLARTLGAGGFDRRISLRARTGDVLIGYGADVATGHFKLAADGGKIDVAGTVDASSAQGGGTIEMYAENDLNLLPSGRLLAKGTEGNADGGEVFLSSETGVVTTQAGAVDPESGPIGSSVSLIDVSGSGSGQGGMVTFRAGRDKVESGAVALDGAIAGARGVRMLAVKKYNDSAVTSTDLEQKVWKKVGTKYQWVYTGWIPDANTFMDTMASRWGYGDIDLIPEIEVWSASTITVSSGLNALQNYRFGGNPGVLTFRAAGNLAVNTDIIDSPGAVEPGMDVKMPVADGNIDTWGLNFVAGADLGSADFMAVKKSTTIGDFTTGAGKQIFSESGSIQFASGRDTVIGVASTAEGFMSGTNYYTMATFDGSVTGSVGRDLKMDTGGVIETGLGDIRLVVGRDILLGDKFSNDRRGAIRTVGRAQNLDELPAWMQSLIAEGGVGADFVQSIRAKRYWDFLEGGNIDIIAGRDISGYVNTASAGWDTKTQYTDVTTTELLGYYEDGTPIITVNDHWGADYAGGAGATQGIATMANGDIAIQVGGAFYGQAAAFGQGDLSIEANGSVNGRFMAMDGTATLTAKENFGSNYAGYTGTQYASAIEIGDTQLTVAALGNIDLGTVSNPEFTAGNMSTVWQNPDGSSGKSEVHSTLSYTEKTSLTARAALGDVSFSGENDFYNDSEFTRLLPASLAMAAGRDIKISKGVWVMAPAAQGSLTLFADRDIQGQFLASMKFSYSSLTMSDMDPADVYGAQPMISKLADSKIQTLHDPEVLHRDDARPVEVKAGRDIAHLGLKVAKRAEVEAGRDIRGINYQGQNITLADVSMVRAGRDIDLQTSAGFTDHPLSIEQAGPGFLLVQAGNSLNLGSSEGIRTVGDTYNKSLSPLVNALAKVKGSDLAVIVGYNLESEKEELAVFFEALAAKGEMYNFLSATGKSEAADIKDDKLSKIMEYITSAIDDPFLDEETLSATMDQFVMKNLSGAGDIRTALSAIAAVAEKDELVNMAAGFANCYKERMLAVLIDPMLAGKKTGSGNIRMVNSKIKTVTGQDDIHILTPGQIDVGTSVLNTSGANTANGIMTEGGGNINVLAEGDINVNESRVVTYFGGRVFMLSNHGDINAGRGSTTTVSPAASGTMLQNGKLVPKFSAPGVGSGIRALTYDPDGPGRLAAASQGDVIAIPWEGTLDAGEAGMFGAKVSIGAQRVNNAKNIKAEGASVGVPVSGATGPSLGAMAGAGMVSDSAKAGDAMGQLNSGKDLASAMNKVAESLNIKMVVVKFIDFEDGSNTTNMGGSNGI